MAPRGFPGFRALPRADGARLAAASRLLPVETGQRLFEAGAPSEFVWGVVDGLVHLVREGADGRRVILEIIPPGELFGAVVALEQRPYPASAEVAEPGTVWQAPASLVRELAQTYPTLRATILQHATSRLRRAHERLHSVAIEPVEQRLARMVLSLLERTAGLAGDAQTVSITRRRLADMIGTTPESVMRIVARWQRAGVVRGARSRLTVLDAQALANLARGFPSSRT